MTTIIMIVVYVAFAVWALNSGNWLLTLLGLVVLYALHLIARSLKR